MSGSQRHRLLSREPARMGELPGELAGMLSAAGLDPAYVAAVIATALAEDLTGGSDVTTMATISATQAGKAEVAARAPGVVAGLEVAEAVFALVGFRDRAGDGLDPVSVTQHAADGDRVDARQVLMTVEGNVALILTAERTALNLLGHMSG